MSKVELRANRSSKEWSDESRALYNRILFDGACLDSDPDLFFPETEGKKLPKETIRLATDICDTCSVKAECREWAIENEDHGIWGGLTATERTKIRKERHDTSN